MLKINYPEDKPTIDKLHAKYLEIFDLDTINDKLTIFFRKKKFENFRKHTAEKILLYSFDRLFKLSNSLKLTPKEKEEIKQIFNYDKSDTLASPKLQPKISWFFMENTDINLASCYFCNIEYVTSFDDIGDYQGHLDFVNRAKKKDLMAIEGIGKVTAEIILKERKKSKIKDVDNLAIDLTQKNNLKRLNVSEKKNHFTLDHVLKKADHPIAGLSLYNFVPSCYSCNSKFKGSDDIVTKANQLYLSPTSKTFDFSNDVSFKLFFPLNKSTKYTDIKTVNDFVLDFDITKNPDDYEIYISTFKLRSRYIFHKREILKLIKKKKMYSNSQLNEINRVTKISVNQLKSDVFGEELFNGEPESTPLTKLKRDIAKDIGIKGIK